MPASPRLEHNGRSWGLLPAETARLVTEGLVVVVDDSDPAEPLYALAPDRLFSELSDHLVPLDTAASRAAVRDGAPPVFSQRPRR